MTDIARIAAFIRKQTCASISVVEPSGLPWCFSAFYAFDEEKMLLHLKSSPETRHGAALKKNPAVCASILPDRLRMLSIKGVQLEGEFLSENDALAQSASSRYHLRFPFSIALPGEIWTIRIDRIKFTDNSLGFGKKLHWERAAFVSPA